MRTGYVLIKVKATMEEDVYCRLSNAPGVVDLQLLFGRYDIIAKIETEEVNPVMDFVTEKIISVPGIVDTEILSLFPLWMYKT